MKIFNVALCSFGMSGLVFHAPFIHAHPGFNLYAVWERSKKTAAGKYPGIISFDSLDEMLADTAIDLVIVNTPNYTHFEFAKKALLAGKHVIIEKSFTVTVSEAKKLIRMAEEDGLQLAVFQNRRYDSDFRTVKKVVDESMLGDIKEVEFHFDRFNLALSPKKHKEETNPGAGLLHDLGAHIIDQAIYLFGMPSSLFAYQRILRPKSRIKDYFDIMLFYPALTVRLKASLVVKELLPAYILHGTKGSFIKMRADIQEDILKNGAVPGTPAWGVEPGDAAGSINLFVEGKTFRNQIISLPGNYMDFYDGVYESVINHKPPPVTATDGLNVMKIIEAAIESDETKQVVSL